MSTANDDISLGRRVTKSRGRSCAFSRAKKKIKYAHIAPRRLQIVSKSAAAGSGVATRELREFQAEPNLDFFRKSIIDVSLSNFWHFFYLASIEPHILALY